MINKILPRSNNGIVLQTDVSILVTCIQCRLIEVNMIELGYLILQWFDKSSYWLTPCFLYMKSVTLSRAYEEVSLSNCTCMDLKITCVHESIYCM